MQLIVHSDIINTVKEQQAILLTYVQEGQIFFALKLSVGCPI